eukprot:TRINITY_DN80_c0_g1_i1.p1 TRINITY_DN80_c0_g1~~TRINITY_DN80_c0_g1_i1.p1  ORF type:complete len:478 (+),score=35.46 TRINITY_DN80_c0_g1_i1:164-1597(+)
MKLPVLVSFVFTTTVCLGQIRILEPSILASQFKDSRVHGSTAAYGTPYYGERLMGRLVYGESQGEQWCRENDYDVPVPSMGISMPNIVVVRRGNCNFVTKTRIAEKFKNASALIVVDTAGSTVSSLEIQRVIMADDGWGTDVKIPSILVSDADGSKIVEELQKKNSYVIAELAWDIPQDKTVSMDFWMTPADQKSSTFLREYANHAMTLRHHLDFRPHYWIYSLPKDYKDLCLDEKAVYCAFDPDIEGNVTGRDVVEESVRQLCLWESTTLVDHSNEVTGDYSEIWWKYAEQRPIVCTVDAMTDHSRFGQECSFNLMKTLGADVNKITECVKHDKERLLEQERSNHAWSPLAMRINDWRYSGPLDADIVTRAVCTGFKQRPEECERLLYPGRVEFQQQIKRMEKDKGKIKMIIALSVIASFILIVILFIFYRTWVVKHLRKELRYEVMSEVKQQMTTSITVNDPVASKNSLGSVDNI